MRNIISHLNIQDWFNEPVNIDIEANGFTIIVRKDISLNNNIDCELLKEILYQGFTLTSINMDCISCFDGVEEERAYSLTFSL